MRVKFSFFIVLAPTDWSSGLKINATQAIVTVSNWEVCLSSRSSSSRGSKRSYVISLAIMEVSREFFPECLIYLCTWWHPAHQIYPLVITSLEDNGNPKSFKRKQQTTDEIKDFIRHKIVALPETINLASVAELQRGSPRGIVANVLDCDIVVSSNSSHTIRFTIGLTPMGKGLSPLYPPPARGW